MSFYTGDRDHLWKPHIRSFNDETEMHVTKEAHNSDVVTFNWTESGNKTKYTIEKANTKLRNLLHHLMTKWEINKPPDAILSIIDGSTEGHLTDKFVRILKKGFVNAARSTGAWILTNGKKKGIVKMIGEAVSEHRIKMQKGNQDLKHKNKYLEDDKIILVAFSNTQDKKDLDEHHFHVKVNIMNTACGDIKMEPHTSSVSTHLKWEFENFMSRQEWLPADAEESHPFRGIPVVRVMYNGNLESLQCMVQSVKDNIPVVVLQGTGGAADFISEASELFSNARSTKDKDLNELAAEHLGISSEELQNEGNPVSDVAGIFKETQHNLKNLVFVYSLEDPKKTLDAYLHEIMFKKFKRADLQIEHQLNLVQKWNRCDIAEKQIFTSANKGKIDGMKTRNPQMFDGLLKKALISSMKDFAILYLDHISDIQSFVKNNLEELFDECIKNNDTGKLFGQRMKTIGLEPPKLENVGKGIQSLFKGASFNPFERHTKVIKTHARERIIMTGNAINLKAKMDENHIRGKKQKGSDSEAYRDLFIWALIFNEKDVSKALWERTSDNICAALYASSLLNALANVASSEGDIELHHAYMDESRHFEGLACDVMSGLYYRENDAAHEILTKQIKLYGSTTNFDLAYTNTLMEFMQHTACQTKINIYWKGKIAPYTSFWRIIVTCLLPVLIYTPLITIQRQGRNNTNTFCDRIKDLLDFFNAPIVKFIFHLSAYVVFLGIFSVFVLSDLYPLSDGGPTRLEYTLMFWILTMVVEECRQIKGKEAKMIKRLNRWFSSVWNKFDLLTFIAFFTTVMLRLFLPSKDFYYARSAYAITLVMFFLRSLQFFLVAKYFGPKVYILGTIAADTIFFILLFTVFVFSFGIMYQSILFPNTELSWQLLKDIVYLPYWQLYGELFIDHIEGVEPSTCSSNPMLYSNGTLPRCPQRNSGNTVFLAVYLVITNVLLLNVLIAMFSNTVTKVEENSAVVWKFYRYGLVQEYCDKPILAPPLIIFAHFYRICDFLQTKYLRKDRVTTSSDTANSKPQRLEIIEKEAADNYKSAPLHRYKMRNDIDIGDRKNQYKQENEVSVRGQLKRLSVEQQDIQRTLEAILGELKILKKKKQSLLVVDVPRPTDQYHVTNFQLPERQHSEFFDN